MRYAGLCLGLGVIMACPLFAQIGPMEAVDPTQYIQQVKPANREQAVEALEVYFLETMFLKGFAGIDQSLLTDEEKENAPFSSDSDYTQQMIMKELAKSMAKKDILGLKKQLLRNQMQQPALERH